MYINYLSNKKRPPSKRLKCLNILLKVGVFYIILHSNKQFTIYYFLHTFILSITSFGNESLIFWCESRDVAPFGGVPDVVTDGICCVAMVKRCESKIDVMDFELLFVLKASDASNCSRRLFRSPASRTRTSNKIFLITQCYDNITYPQNWKHFPKSYLQFLCINANEMY